MTRSMTATELKARILSVLDEVAAGEQVEITKRGRLVAKLVPAVSGRSLRGQFADVAMTAVEDDEELFTTDTTWSLR